MAGWSRGAWLGLRRLQAASARLQLCRLELCRGISVRDKAPPPCCARSSGAHVLPAWAVFLSRNNSITLISLKRSPSGARARIVPYFGPIFNSTAASGSINAMVETHHIADQRHWGPLCFHDRGAPPMQPQHLSITALACQGAPSLGICRPEIKNTRQCAP